MRDGERERQTDRQTGRQTGRQTERCFKEKNKIQGSSLFLPTTKRKADATLLAR